MTANAESECLLPYWSTTEIAYAGQVQQCMQHKPATCLVRNVPYKFHECRDAMTIYDHPKAQFIRHLKTCTIDQTFSIVETIINCPQTIQKISDIFRDKRLIMVDPHLIMVTDR